MAEYNRAEERASRHETHSRGFNEHRSSSRRAIRSWRSQGKGQRFEPKYASHETDHEKYCVEFYSKVSLNFFFPIPNSIRISLIYQFNCFSNPDSKLMNNIQKLFAAKIEIFSQVDFNKVSVLTGIVKITLKTLLECVRLKTFSKYGLQQIQVDCHYLQLYLWRFVNDEKFELYFLIT